MILFLLLLSEKLEEYVITSKFNSLNLRLKKNNEN